MGACKSTLVANCIMPNTIAICHTVNAIQERCIHKSGEKQSKKNTEAQITGEITSQGANINTGSSLADVLLKQEYSGDSMPFDLKRKKKRKKRNINQ